MTIESLPAFTKPARQRWESIPADIRQRLMSNVWCGRCRHETTITNSSGAIKGGDLLLVGKCADCHSDVARVPLPEVDTVVAVLVYAKHPKEDRYGWRAVAISAA